MLALLLLANALAQDAPVAPEPPVAPDPPPAAPEPPAAVLMPFTDPFDTVLAEAERRYLAGDPDGAVELLLVLQQRLSFGEIVDAESGNEALIYLGEIRYNLGMRAEATAAFRQVLEKDPDALINPYRHPNDIIGAFDVVRQTVKAEIAAREAEPPIERRRPPLWTLAPLGIPQLAQGQTGRGLAYAGAQGALGILSIAMGVHLQLYNGTLANPVQWELSETPEARRRVQTLRYGVQWPATLGFYAMWAVSVADGRATYAEPPPEPLPDLRPGIGVSWRF